MDKTLKNYVFRFLANEAGYNEAKLREAAAFFPKLSEGRILLLSLASRPDRFTLEARWALQDILIHA